MSFEPELSCDAAFSETTLSIQCGSSKGVRKSGPRQERKQATVGNVQVGIITPSFHFL